MSAGTVPPRAAIVIATRNRVDEVRDLIASAAGQTVPAEILVMDDGGSAELERMVREEFPHARYYNLGIGLGPSDLRNRGIELASAPFVFPLDDDVVFPSPHTLEQTIADFDDPLVAAVAIPFVNVRADDRVHHRAPTNEGTWVAAAFTAASVAMRRDVFLRLGGYRAHFFYTGEELDLGVRLLEAGYVVRLGRADPLHHLESPRRSRALVDYTGRRNDILFAWHNTPWPMLPVHLAATTLNGLRWAMGAEDPRHMLRGTLHGYLGCFTRWRERRPVPWRIYFLHRRLKKRGPRRLEDVRGLLPPHAR